MHRIGVRAAVSFLVARLPNGRSRVLEKEAEDVTDDRGRSLKKSR